MALGAYELAGIDPSEVDVAEVHDAFTATEVIHYEDLLLCKRWNGSRMVDDGDEAGSAVHLFLREGPGTAGTASASRPGPGP